MKSLYCSCFLLLGIFLSFAQQKVLSLKERFSQVDSIQMISHEDLVLRIDTIPGKKGIYERREIIKNGVVNREIIRESITLNPKSVGKLYSILMYEGYEASESLACSFDPHHSILIYKHGICFCIDVCFSCGGYWTSESLLEKSLLTNPESGAELYKFFKENKIQYKIPDWKDCSYCMASDYNKKHKNKKKR